MVPPRDVAAVTSAGTVAVPDGPGRRGARAVAESVLPLALVGAVSLAPVLGSDPIISRGGQLIFATLAGLTGVAALARQRRTTRLGLAFTATIAAFAMPWEVSWWPLPGLVGVGIYLAAGQLPMLRTGHMTGWRFGRLGRAELAAVAVLGLIATSALLIYQRLTPGSFGLGATLLNQLPGWSPPLAGLAFVAINAAVEELLYRGLILTHLAGAVGTWPALLAQAGGFGVLNLHGYPAAPLVSP